MLLHPTKIYDFYKFYCTVRASWQIPNEPWSAILDRSPSSAFIRISPNIWTWVYNFIELMAVWRPCRSWLIGARWPMWPGEEDEAGAIALYGFYLFAMPEPGDIFIYFQLPGKRLLFRINIDINERNSNQWYMW